MRKPFAAMFLRKAEDSVDGPAPPELANTTLPPLVLGSRTQRRSRRDPLGAPFAYNEDTLVEDLVNSIVTKFPGGY